MNLRSIRIRLTLLFAAMAAIAVASIAWYAIGQGGDSVFESAEREAEQAVKDVAVARLSNTEPDVSNAWTVTVKSDSRYTVPLGETWVEPPLYSIVESASEWPGFFEFEQNGPWLAYSEPVDATNWVVAAISLTEYDSDVGRLRWRISAAAIASIIATSLVGYWLAGRALAPARRAMAQQRDFIADAAHELRTPLAVIQASSGHALARERSDAEYRAALGEVLEATQRAGSSVSELLELARLDAGQAQPRIAPLRADLLIEEVAASHRSDSSTVTADSDEPIVVKADYTLLRQALDTLMRNGAARASEVALTARVAGRNCVFTIADNGPGFEPGSIDHVFDRFRRGDSHGSSGLGMAIAKQIVEAHRGTIDAANRTEGGAIVTITVALADDAWT